MWRATNHSSQSPISTIREPADGLPPFIQMKLPDCIRLWQVHKSGKGRVWLPIVQCAQAGGD
jgi:hypothetical protein